MLRSTQQLCLPETPQHPPRSISAVIYTLSCEASERKRKCALKSRQLQIFVPSARMIEALAPTKNQHQRPPSLQSTQRKMPTLVKNQASQYASSLWILHESISSPLLTKRSILFFQTMEASPRGPTMRRATASNEPRGLRTLTSGDMISCPGRCFKKPGPWRLCHITLIPISSATMAAV